ncbi:hypothetical protein [Ascidiimonas sp. W6]|uniref:hypothetical protein n=1 Tax=Ascidiimonas meishanensis TaxID=3128903 RepID=UPI0030ECED38
MKRILLLTALVSLSFTASNSLPDLSKTELNNSCKVLSVLTNKAVIENRKDLIVVYYNAYSGIRESESMNAACDDFFKEIKTKYLSQIPKFTLAFDYPPKQLQAGNGQGFLNSEIQTLERIKANNLNLDDIDELVLFKKLQANTVDINILKNLDKEKIKNLQKKLEKLNPDALDIQKLNNLGTQQLNLEQFQQQMNN